MTYGEESTERIGRTIKPIADDAVQTAPSIQNLPELPLIIC